MAINDIQFRSTITLSEKVRLVTNIVESLFFDDGYMPEIYEEQFWISVAEAYLEEGFSLDSTVDEFMDAYYNGGLREKLDESINSEQLESIRVAVGKRIEMRLSKRPADEFFEKAAVLLTQIENTLTGVDLKGALDAFGKLDVSAEIAKVLAKNRNPKEEK
jgi:hypothetical protein